MSSFNGSINPARRNKPAVDQRSQERTQTSKSARDDGPWPEPNYIEPSIMGTINSIHAHLRRGVPIS